MKQSLFEDSSIIKKKCMTSAGVKRKDSSPRTPLPVIWFNRSNHQPNREFMPKK
jgi:hypothetical protein